MFPDQRCWILRLARHRNRHMQVADLFKECGFCGPPELLSMFTCLFGDIDLTAFLQTMPKGWLETHFAAIVKARSHPCISMRPRRRCCFLRFLAFSFSDRICVLKANLLGP